MQSNNEHNIMICQTPSLHAQIKPNDVCHTTFICRTITLIFRKHKYPQCLPIPESEKNRCQSNFLRTLTTKYGVQLNPESSQIIPMQ